MNEFLELILIYRLKRYIFILYHQTFPRLFMVPIRINYHAVTPAKNKKSRAIFTDCTAEINSENETFRKQ